MRHEGVLLSRLWVMWDPWVQEGGPGEIQQRYTCFYEQVSGDRLRNPEKPQFQNTFGEMMWCLEKTGKNLFSSAVYHNELLFCWPVRVSCTCWLAGVSLLVPLGIFNYCWEESVGPYSVHEMYHTNTWYLNNCTAMNRLYKQHNAR